MDGRRQRSMRAWWITAALLTGTAAVAHAAGIEADKLPQSTRIGLAWQIALDRAGFSPGLVDGRPGGKTTLATQEFQKSHNLPPTGKLDADTAKVLLDPPVNLLTTYTVSDNDAKLITGTTTDWNAKAAMPFLGYAGLAELVGERFHTTRKCLESLNPGVNFDKLKPGDELTTPAVVEPDGLGRVARLEINLLEKAIRAFDASGGEIALFHCSIAKDVAKRPTGSARVVVITPNPAYSFDPKMWPDVTNVSHKLLIPPGPRNPVGMCWIGLSLPGYGIHGTPAPEMIGKTGSHGCFRLTNWDAVRLGKITPAGVPVKFVNEIAVAVTEAPAPTPKLTAAPPDPVKAAATLVVADGKPAGAAAKLKNLDWNEVLMGTVGQKEPTQAPAVVDESVRSGSER